MAAPDLVATYASDGLPLSKSYAELWREFARLVDLKVQPSSLQVESSQLDPGRTLRLEFGKGPEPLALLGAASRGAPQTNKLDIYLSGTQVVGRIPDGEGGTRWVVLRSEFEVLYLNALEIAVKRRDWRSRE